MVVATMRDRMFNEDDEKNREDERDATPQAPEPDESDYNLPFTD